MIHRVKKGLIRRYQNFLHKKAKTYFSTNVPELFEILENYKKQEGASGGASYSDYLVLYNYVRREKPKMILELGTGLTTVVLAYALKHNDEDGLYTGLITSMEESEAFHKTAEKLMPQFLKKYVEILHGEKIEGYYALFRGVKYKGVPARPYDLVYIDGPTTYTLTDKQKTFDFDFIDVVSRSEKPVFGIIDGRHSTGWVFRHIFGKDKVHYDFIKNIGYVGPVTKKDLNLTNQFADF